MVRAHAGALAARRLVLCPRGCRRLRAWLRAPDQKLAWLAWLRRLLLMPPRVRLHEAASCGAQLSELTQ